jgi:hypothetical protein
MDYVEPANLYGDTSPPVSIFLLKCVGRSGAFWGVSGRFGAFKKEKIK